MSTGLRGDLPQLGVAYHELFMGEDTDRAEAAAIHLATTLDMIRQALTAQVPAGGFSARST